MDAKSWFNRFLPLSGNIGTQQVRTVGLSTTATAIDLRSIFGSLDNGDGVLVKADGLGQPSGWRAYFSLGDKSGAAILEAGNGPGTASGAQAWPLQDGQEIFGHLTSGRIVATGFATQVSFHLLNAKSSIGSGTLKLMRHSLVEPQDASRFQFPDPSLPTAIAQGLTAPSGAWPPRP